MFFFIIVFTLFLALVKTQSGGDSSEKIEDFEGITAFYFDEGTCYGHFKEENCFPDSKEFGKGISCRPVPNSNIYYNVAMFSERRGVIHSNTKLIYPPMVEVIYFNDSVCSELYYTDPYSYDVDLENIFTHYETNCVVLHQHLSCNESIHYLDPRYECESVEYAKFYRHCNADFKLKYLFDNSNNGYPVVFFSCLFLIIVFLVIFLTTLFIILCCFRNKFMKLKDIEGSIEEDNNYEKMKSLLTDDIIKSNENIFVNFVTLLKSILMIIVFLIKDSLALWIILICLDVPVDQNMDAFITVNQVNEMISFFLLLFVVLYVLTQIILIIIFVRKYVFSSFKMCFAIMCLKENFIFRYFIGGFYLFFFFYGILVVVLYESTLAHFKSLASGDRFGTYYRIFIYFTQIAFTHLIILNKFLSIQTYDSPVSISYLRRFNAIKYFPRINISFVRLIYSGNEEFVQELLYMLSIIEKKEDIELRRNCVDYTHLRWFFMQNLSDEEILFLKSFFNDFESKSNPSSTFWNIFWYTSPLKMLWRNNFFSNENLKKKVEKELKNVKDDVATKTSEAEEDVPNTDDSTKQLIGEVKEEGKE